MSPEGPLLVLDTATDVAVLGVVDGGELLSETTARPVALLAGADALLERGGLAPDELAGVVVGVGPGRYTSLRIGLASARAVATALGIPIAGVSTLHALAAGAPETLPLIDARRGEVFAREGDVVVCVSPARLRVAGAVCIGDGALAYRAELESRGAEVPVEHDPRHRLAPVRMAGLATAFGEPAEIEPVYMRVPDAERTRKEFRRA